MLGIHSFGIYEKAFDASDTWQARLQKAKRLGFDFVEISIDEQDERIERLYWSKGKTRELRDIIFDTNIPIRSMCLSAHRRYPFGSADVTKREKAHDLLKRALDFSSEIGIRVIQLAGYDVYYEPSTKESRQLFTAGMGWAAKMASNYQIMLGMEIMDTEHMNSIRKHMKLEHEIDSPWYKVYPDIGNLTAWGNDVEEELRIGRGSIVGVHLKDTIPVTRESPGIFKCVAFGNGSVDFASCFTCLEMQGYHGPYMIEMWHQKGTNDILEIKKSKAFLEKQYSVSLKGITT